MIWLFSGQGADLALDPACMLTTPTIPHGQHAYGVKSWAGGGIRGKPCMRVVQQAGVLCA